MDDQERYQLYLCSREWGLLREAVRERCGGLCERCKTSPMSHVHHLTYIRKYHELLEDLQGLCVGCHEFIHGRIKLGEVVLDGEGESWRVKRLGRMLESIEEEVPDGMAAGEWINSLSDHEGCCTVDWRRPPSRHMLLLVANAWKGQQEEMMEHTFESDELAFHVALWPILVRALGPSASRMLYGARPTALVDWGTTLKITCFPAYEFRDVDGWALGLAGKLLGEWLYNAPRLEWENRSVRR